jgi:hypothetical protein
VARVRELEESHTAALAAAATASAAALAAETAQRVELEQQVAAAACRISQPAAPPCCWLLSASAWNTSLFMCAFLFVDMKTKSRVQD